MNRQLFVLVSLAGLIYIFFYGLGEALSPLLISFALAYLSFPLIRKLETKGVNRTTSVILVFSFITLAILGALILVIPSLINDLKAFARELPEALQSALDTVQGALHVMGFEVRIRSEEIIPFIKRHSNKIQGNVISGVSSQVGGLFSGLARSIISILNWLLVPMFFFYVVNDFEKISSQVESLVPKNLKPKLSSYLSHTNEVLSGFIRGQLIVALCLGGIYAAGLGIIGLRFGVIIGLLAGLLSIIPYFGSAFGIVLALVVSASNFSGWPELVGIIVVFGVGQALEGFVITPKVVGDKVGLSAFATVLALIIGGNLMGIIGMLAAIPVAAILKRIFADLMVEYQKMDFNKT